MSARAAGLPPDRRRTRRWKTAKAPRFARELVWVASTCLACELGRDVVARSAPSTGDSGTVWGDDAGEPGVGAFPGVGGTHSGYGGSTETYPNEARGGGGVESGGSGAGPSGGTSNDPGGGDTQTGGEPPLDCSQTYPRVALGTPSPTGSSTGSSTLQTSADLAAGSAFCSASLARDRLSHALCACGDLDVPGLLATHAFDSGQPASEFDTGAAVAVNGSYVRGDYARIRGSLSIAGTNQLALTLLGLDIAGDLKLGTGAVSTGPIRVGRDAWFAESISVLTETYIGRDLHLARGASVNGLLSEHVGGRTLRDLSELDAPCRCGDDAAFDLAANVEAARLQNDDASIGIAPDALSNPTGAVQLELPCGRYYLTELRSERSVRLQVTGRVALFVAGDVGGSGELNIELAPDAELDWFIAGRWDPRAAGRIGDPERAGRLRIYVAGSASISYPPARVAGNLHAPRAHVTISGVGDVYGSISARDIRSANALTVHYDRSVIALADACTRATEPNWASNSRACAGCGECGAGLACVAGSRETGMCTTCVSDADCCSPLVCDGGRCQLLLSE